MDQQRFWKLVSLKLSFEATADELQELENLIQENPETGLKLDVISGIWNENEAPADVPLLFNEQLKRLKRVQEETNIDTFSNTNTHLFSLTSKTKKKLLYLAAACVIAIVFLWAHFAYTGSIYERKQASNIIATQKGSRTMVQLPDGSTVWMNADSKIHYNEHFKGDLREVQLEGEAFLT